MLTCRRRSALLTHLQILFHVSPFALNENVSLPAGIINFSRSGDGSPQTCHPVIVLCLDIIHRTCLFVLSLCLLCTCISWETSSPSSLNGCRNNHDPVWYKTDQFPQLHISISKCQTTLWLPAHLSLPVYTLLLLMTPGSPLVPVTSYIMSVHLKYRVLLWIHE